MLLSIVKKTLSTILGTATGSVGVMSYDIEGTNHKAVIFWMVPFDFNIFDVKLNIKVSHHAKY